MSQTPITDGLKKAYAPKQVKAGRFPTPATDALVARIEKDRKRAHGEVVADSLDELVAKKLDGFVGRRQIENEIQGKYGSLSTPRVDQRLKIRNLWWASPDGIEVKKLLRDPEQQGSEDGEIVLKSIKKSHSEAHAAIARLDA